MTAFSSGATYPTPFVKEATDVWIESPLTLLFLLLSLERFDRLELSLIYERPDLRPPCISNWCPPNKRIYGEMRPIEASLD